MISFKSTHHIMFSSTYTVFICNVVLNKTSLFCFVIHGYEYDPCFAIRGKTIGCFCIYLFMPFTRGNPECSKHIFSSKNEMKNSKLDLILIRYYKPILEYILQIWFVTYYISTPDAEIFNYILIPG